HQSILHLPVAHPRRAADGHREIRKEVPAHVSAGDGAAELGVVAEREAHDAGTVSVIRNPWFALGDSEQRVEADPDLAEHPPGVTAAAHLGFDGVPSAHGRDIDDAPFREAEFESLDRTAVPLRRWKRDHAVDAVLERRDADHA